MKNMTARFDLRPLIASALLSTVACSFVVTPASAGTIDPPTQTVKFADLDVAQPRDAAILYSRIRTAAEELCSPLQGSGMGLATRAAKVHTCVQHSIAGAVASVGKPALSAVYAARNVAPAPNRIAVL
jgi:UrcA family protein